jgi:DoxX-like family
VADALSWLGWRSPMRTTAITQLADGINGDPAGWIAATGITPKSLDELLALHPATVQDRWFARLYILKPLAIAVLAAFWITSGLIALGPGRAGAMLILRLAGASLGVAKGAVLVGAVLDIVLGLAVLVRRFARTALIAMLAISLGYVAAAAVATPHLLADPLGSILKIFPIMLATLFVLAILDER